MANDSAVVDILSKNRELFRNNTIWGSAFRWIGWIILMGLATLAGACDSLYQNCFKLVDFTTYAPVQEYLDKYKEVFVALLCMALAALGIIYMVWQDKKPTIVINVLIAIAVVSSSTYMIDSMNKFLTKDVRNEIMGDGKSGFSVYTEIGNKIHDLVYLDSQVGLINLNEKNGDGGFNRDITYSNFTKDEFDAIDINEVVFPDDMDGESKDIVSNKLVTTYSGNDVITMLEENYNGVAWTDALNTYYYRYTVDWGFIYLELISLILVYLFMSYKVIRLLYEIVIHELLAKLYSANITNNQKVVKVLDSLKDSYLVILLTMVCIKIYLLACKYVDAMNVSDITKGLILIFIALAVIDGPNIIQKLTGIDAGLSDGMGRMMSVFYGGSAVARTAGMAVGAARTVGRAGGWLFNQIPKGEDSGISRNSLNRDVASGASNGSPDGSINGGMDNITSDNSMNMNQNGQTDSRSNQMNSMSNVNSENPNISNEASVRNGNVLQSLNQNSQMQNNENATSNVGEYNTERGSSDGRDIVTSAGMGGSGSTMKPEMGATNTGQGIGRDVTGRAASLNRGSIAGGNNSEMQRMSRDLDTGSGRTFSKGEGQGHMPMSKGNLLSGGYGERPSGYMNERNISERTVNAASDLVGQRNSLDNHVADNTINNITNSSTENRIIRRMMSENTGDGQYKNRKKDKE